MLFILTGDIQIGKTRWLQRLIATLEGEGVRPYGVVAPGVWIERASDEGVPSYEKLGIDNELLPQHERISFARRSDLMPSEEADRSCTQSQRAQLAWSIDDAAIQAVNDHFDGIAQQQLASPDDDGRGFLVVDEFGRLELLFGEGLTSALSIVDRGATPSIPHGLIMVRDQLLELALERFADAPWNGIRVISPDDEARGAVLSAFGA